MAMHGQIDFREFARAVGTVMSYAEDDIVFRENDPPNYMYIVLSGSVEIISHGKVIETIHEGNALGIISLLDDEPRTTTACARERSELAIMDRRKFRYMVEEIPNFVWYVMDELAHRLRTTNAAL
jgi:CRP/FNR family cyclic AMP-dependent transcriptional regulator